MWYIIVYKTSILSWHFKLKIEYLYLLVGIMSDTSHIKSIWWHCQFWTSSLFPYRRFQQEHLKFIVGMIYNVSLRKIMQTRKDIGSSSRAKYSIRTLHMSLVSLFSLLVSHSSRGHDSKDVFSSYLKSRHMLLMRPKHKPVVSPSLWWKSNRSL